MWFVCKNRINAGINFENLKSNYKMFCKRLLKANKTTKLTTFEEVSFEGFEVRGGFEPPYTVLQTGA